MRNADMLLLHVIQIHFVRSDEQTAESFDKEANHIQPGEHM